MIDRLIKIGRCCGMGINMDKSNVTGISRVPTPVQIMVNQEQLEMWNISTTCVA
jgi:hypothetical protein